MNQRSLTLFSLLICAVACLATAPRALAQKKNRNPTSKFYVADLNGEAQVDTGDRIDDLEKKSVYNADGTIIETKSDSNYAMVYSNGTGIYFDPSTRVHVQKFVQEPFKPNRSDMETEPSISQTQAVVEHGMVGLCTSKLVAGSHMDYMTPFGSLSMHGRKAVVDVKDNSATIEMLEGDSTVKAGDLDMGGHILHEGEKAVLTKDPTTGKNHVSIQKLTDQEKAAANDKVSAACLARKTVYFDVRAKTGVQINGATAFDAVSADQEIVAVPVTSSALPTQFTISPANLGP